VLNATVYNDEVAVLPRYLALPLYQHERVIYITFQKEKGTTLLT